ncbi:MAG TPA: T9SS type A sorting domain-containing protein [Candidatus Cloacimonetes bacterium]|nr:T9SS type A sorting domain-containing protein [Candidatus Cloacimonadota bacterium]
MIVLPPGGGPIIIHDDPAEWMVVNGPGDGEPPVEEFNFTVQSNYNGAAIYKNNVDTGEVTPHMFTGTTDAIAGVYTLQLGNITWFPESYNYDGLTDQTVTFQGTDTPGVAINPTPADGATFEIAHDALATTYNLSWEAPAGNVTGYRLTWLDNPEVDLGDVLTWTTPEIAEGTYTWKVVPYITDPILAPAPLGRSTGGLQVELAPIKASISSSQAKGDAVGAPVWTFTITRQDAPPQEFNLTVKSNYVGSAIYKDNVDTGQVTPWTFSGFTADIAGVYKVVRAETDWAPADYTYNGLADAEVVFMGTMTPGQAWDPVPQHDTIITLASGVDPKPWTLRWQHPTTGPAHEGYRLYWCEDNTDNPTIYNLGADVTTWETPALDAGHYYWKVVAYITDPPAPAKAAKSGNVIETAVKASLIGPGIKGDAPGYTPEYWHFEVQHEAGPATYSLTVVAMTSTSQLLTAAIYKDNVDTGQTTIHTFNDITANVAGTYHVVLDGWTFDPANFVYDGTYNHTVTFIGTEDDPTLPVELSSFTATLTAQNFVKLTWVSQTETGMWGYRVYRGESPDQASALLLTPTLIPATNTSTTQVYNLEDREVEIGTTYWYWLEAVEMTGVGQFYGQPVSVTVEGELPPVIPTETIMGNAYPNPFKQTASTSIDVSIKAGENGTVTIYNILGQAVKTFRVNEGNHKLTWNGKDARGNNCGSGIYFYKLSTPSKNVTKKMVIVK